MYIYTHMCYHRFRWYMTHLSIICKCDVTHMSVALCCHRPKCHITLLSIESGYAVATICRLLQFIGLFCKRALWKRRYFAKETYNFKEPTNRSHPISQHICELYVGVTWSTRLTRLVFCPMLSSTRVSHHSCVDLKCGCHVPHSRDICRRDMTPMPFCPVQSLTRVWCGCHINPLWSICRGDMTHMSHMTHMSFALCCPRLLFMSLLHRLNLGVTLLTCEVYVSVIWLKISHMTPMPFAPCCPRLRCHITLLSTEWNCHVTFVNYM